MPSIPHETELKLVLAPGEGAKVAAIPPLAGAVGARARYSAISFDTPTRELSRHGLGLRLRREGRHWRVTLKASGSTAAGLHQRPEWEYPVPGPVLDLSRFAGTPLAELPGAASLHERLAPTVTTEFRRTRWVLEPQPGARLEVALDEGRIVEGPRDVSRTNFMPLADSLGMLQAFVLPETVPERQRWRIDDALRTHLMRALALRPRESDEPRYDETSHPDGYARWFFVGDGRRRYPDGLRVLGKSGMAYGYLSEVAHVHDADSGAEFLLAASIHCNADGIYNDDRYDYDDVGLPFLAEVAHAVLAAERDACAGRAARVCGVTMPGSSGRSSGAS